MKNKDLLIIKDALEDIKDIEAPVEFSLFIARNINIIDNEIKILKSTLNPVEEYYSVYKKKINELIVEYCDKDSNGKPIVGEDDDRRSYRFTERMEEFNKAVEEYESSDNVKDILERQKEYNTRTQEIELMKANVTLIKVDKKHLPKMISASKIQPIIELINF